MKQVSFANAQFERFVKTTRSAVFLAVMEKVVPWLRVYGLIALYHPKLGKGGRLAGLDRMLRIYFLQNRFDLSYPAAEEALDSSQGTAPSACA